MVPGAARLGPHRSPVAQPFTLSHTKTSGRPDIPTCTDTALLDGSCTRRAARRSSYPPSARQRALTDAAPCRLDRPPEGPMRQAPAPLRSARATTSWHPPSPPRGGCAGRCAPVGRAAAPPCLRSRARPRLAPGPPPRQLGSACAAVAGWPGLRLPCGTCCSLLQRRAIYGKAALWRQGPCPPHAPGGATPQP